MSNQTATEFMNNFSGGQKSQPVREDVTDPRGEPIEQWEAGKWVTRWSKTGQEVK